jgi:uncharacterized Zn finger protein
MKTVPDYHSSNGYDLLAVVQGSKEYRVSRRVKDGVLTCNCPSWVHRTGTKNFMGQQDTCKHIRGMLEQALAEGAFMPTSKGLDFLMEFVTQHKKEE